MIFEYGMALSCVVAWCNPGGTDANTRSMNGVQYQRRFINPDASLFCETDVRFGLSQTIGSSSQSMSLVRRRAGSDNTERRWFDGLT